MTGDYIAVITPLLLHMVLSDLTAFLFGGWLDSASCTALASLLVIPLGIGMYRRDIKSGNVMKREGDTGKPFLFGGFCFLMGGLLNLAWSQVLIWLRIGEHFSNQTQEALLAGQFLVQVTGLGVLVPVAEELIFRGLIYNRMKRIFPRWLAVVMSAALFAVYHGNPIQIIFAFPMALALIWTYEHGKLFVFPVLFHMGANLTAVFLNFFA